MQYRIGNGYDVHRFAASADSTEAVHLIIGGVQIRHSRALLAHSDGDVLVHALCDAILGALALGDIGRHFPDSDPQYRNCSSLLLLQHVLALVRQQGWELGNADLTLVAQLPRIAPYVAAIQQSLSQCMAVSTAQISVKATTTEGLGFAGREEGVACYAVVLLQRMAT